LKAIALLIFIIGALPSAQADETDARNILKKMSDYIGKQKSISFDLDSSLDVVTQDQQKLSIASSSKIQMRRPNKLSIQRKGGFAETDLLFNGKTLWVYRKDKNIYAKLDFPGTVENLMDELSNKWQRPLPGADLFVTNFFESVMPHVVNVKDLGSGFIRGVECDHLAFKTDDVDWQIWVVRGLKPYPMRLTITSSKVPAAPQYVLDVLNFKSGLTFMNSSFAFHAPKAAKEVTTTELNDFDELPEYFKPQN
jgi:hypothetical protein